MNREEYYKHIEENDTYPEHSHKWIVRTYIDTMEEEGHFTNWNKGT